MMFCPKCKSIVMPKAGKLVCSCGFSKTAEPIKITESVSKKPEMQVVASEEASINIIIDAICPKCSNKKAEYWELQTRSADEPPTRFHKCTKCKHTWREYK